MFQATTGLKSVIFYEGQTCENSTLLEVGKMIAKIKLLAQKKLLLYHMAVREIAGIRFLK